MLIFEIVVAAVCGEALLAVGFGRLLAHSSARTGAVDVRAAR